MKLSELPNIGKTLEQKLLNAGITSHEQLSETGAENTFLRLEIEDESACYNMLCALEGAIQGIRWHQLSKERKDELKEFLRLKRM
ncbi:TfoX/Sxy family protein [Draconibacterium sediminis]|uniref:Competence protein TfoX n=1 Tax=Draconibacterium sediminis TaxID=1544798 RepID=A0A0D8J7J5_9BACT|nr:TfoX/Sxy family protein [Draconibacterium sediminis]KJF42491.1 competence protein TfoX [Draconibacterium sediminis]